MIGILDKNKKRGNIFLGVTVALFFWIMGIIFLPFMVQTVDYSRADLQCTSPISITDGIKLDCLLNDLLIPYFIWTVASLALGYMVGAKT